MEMKEGEASRAEENPCLVTRALWTDTSLKRAPKSYRGLSSRWPFFRDAHMTGNEEGEWVRLPSFSSRQSEPALHL